MLAGAEMDVVYAAGTHDQRCPVAQAAIATGTPALVEKPFGLSAASVRDVLAEAARRRVLVMEALWTRCLPVYRLVHAWLADGAIGEPRQVVARFGFRAVGDEGGPRLRDPARGGGALFDVGPYPIWIAQFALGPRPERVVATAHMVGGIDEQFAAALRFPGGATALVGGAMEVESDYTATIDGTAGRITIPEFWRASEATLENDAGVQRLEAPLTGGGWAHEAVHMHDLVRAGAVESPLVPHDDSIARAEIIDAILAEIRR
jgi:predicted dehydrogenase